MKTFTLYTISITYHKFPLAKRDSAGNTNTKLINVTTDYSLALQALSDYVNTINTYIANNSATKSNLDLFTLKKISDISYATTSFSAPVNHIEIITNNLNCLEDTDTIIFLDSIY